MEIISRPNENKSAALSVTVDRTHADKIAATAWQLVREQLASNMSESDESLRYRLNEFADIIQEVGIERFQQAIQRCLRIYSKRWEVTIAAVRREAGLDCSPAKPAYVEAWEVVTRIVRYHLKMDANGNVRIESRVTRSGTRIVLHAAVGITPAIERAVDMMGGWQSLYESWPTFWGARQTHFKEIYQP